jgi:hypothetical protein
MLVFDAPATTCPTDAEIGAGTASPWFVRRGNLDRETGLGSDVRRFSMRSNAYRGAMGAARFPDAPVWTFSCDI